MCRILAFILMLCLTVPVSVLAAPNPNDNALEKASGNARFNRVDGDDRKGKKDKKHNDDDDMKEKKEKKEKKAKTKVTRKRINNEPETRTISARPFLLNLLTHSLKSRAWFICSGYDAP